MEKISPDLKSLLTPVRQLKPNARNVKRHGEPDTAALARSLEEFGQQKPIVALKDGTVIAGNGTLAAALSLGWKKLAVVRFADEKKARAFAIADNRTAELSTWDEDEREAALRAMREEGDAAIAAIGYSEIEIDRMLAEENADAEAEWQGMPEFDQKDKTAHRQIVMNFRSDEDAAAFGVLLGQSVTDKTRSLWFPKAEIERLMDKRYAADDAA